MKSPILIMGDLLELASKLKLLRECLSEYLPDVIRDIIISHYLDINVNVTEAFTWVASHHQLYLNKDDKTFVVSNSFLHWLYDLHNWPYQTRIGKPSKWYQCPGASPCHLAGHIRQVCNGTCSDDIPCECYNFQKRLDIFISNLKN